jgi:ribosomal protein L15
MVYRCSKVAMGSSGRGGRRQGPAAGAGDKGGEGPPGRGERSVQVELTVEGENGDGDGSTTGAD